MLKYLKNLLTSFLIWIKPPKIGQIHLEAPASTLEQDVRMNKKSFEVDMEEWADTFAAVFETDNFASDGITRAVRPTDEILKKKIQLFFRDYSQVIKKTDQLYTKHLNINNTLENEN